MRATWWAVHVADARERPAAEQLPGGGGAGAALPGRRGGGEQGHPDRAAAGADARLLYQREPHHELRQRATHRAPARQQGRSCAPRVGGGGGAPRSRLPRLPERGRDPRAAGARRSRPPRRDAGERRREPRRNGRLPGARAAAPARPPPAHPRAAARGPAELRGVREQADQLGVRRELGRGPAGGGVRRAGGGRSGARVVS
mmetsp:Transcript_48855/g.158695  ORF Transcript_48855/g.158695 Transcript_48855/m.158695 type:complete len:201 (-) Transcript_48855:41-643(-)